MSAPYATRRVGQLRAALALGLLHASQRLAKGVDPNGPVLDRLRYDAALVLVDGALRIEGLPPLVDTLIELSELERLSLSNLRRVS